MHGTTTTNNWHTEHENACTEYGWTSRSNHTLSKCQGIDRCLMCAAKCKLENHYGIEAKSNHFERNPRTEQSKTRSLILSAIAPTEWDLRCVAGSNAVWINNMGQDQPTISWHSQNRAVHARGLCASTMGNDSFTYAFARQIEANRNKSERHRHSPKSCKVCDGWFRVWKVQYGKQDREKREHKLLKLCCKTTASNHFECNKKQRSNDNPSSHHSGCHRLCFSFNTTTNDREEKQYPLSKFNAPTMEQELNEIRMRIWLFDFNMGQFQHKRHTNIVKLGRTRKQ